MPEPPNEISIHAPHEGERPSAHHSQKDDKGISIHAPHEGERHRFNSYIRGACLFQSTLPTRGSDQCTAAATKTARYFNPRSPRGGATTVHTYIMCHDFISIHAPHEGERRRRNRTMCGSARFQSTLPTRGSDV